MLTDELQLSQNISTLVSALVAARAFPGLLVVPHLETAWTYHVRHPLAGVDHENISIEDLGVVVENTVVELQSLYGERGEALKDEPVLVQVLI